MTAIWMRRRSERNEKTDFCPSADKVNVISVGRLSYEKGYDILIDNFARAYKRRQDIHLYLVGDGDEREKLEERIKMIDESLASLG